MSSDSKQSPLKEEWFSKVKSFLKIKDKVLKIFISGITGKVGQLLTPLILEDKQLELVGVVVVQVASRLVKI